MIAVSRNAARGRSASAICAATRSVAAAAARPARTSPERSREGLAHRQRTSRKTERGPAAGLALLLLKDIIDCKRLLPRSRFALAGLTFVLWAAAANLWGIEAHFMTLLRVMLTIVLAVLLPRAIATLPEALAGQLDRWI